MIHSEKPKRKGRKKKTYFPVGLRLWMWIVGCFVGTLICIAILFFGGFALIFANSYSTCFGTPFPANQDVENGALFKFPPSAQHIEYDAESWHLMEWNCTAWVTFEIDPSDIEIFQESTLAGSLEQIHLDEEQGTFSYFMEKKGWSQPIDSLAGHDKLDTYPETDQWVIVDTSLTDRFIIYIITDVNGI